MKEFYHIIKYLLLFFFLYTAFTNWKCSSILYETLIGKIILFIAWVILGFFMWIGTMLLIRGILSIDWGNYLKDFFQWVINL